MASANLRQVPDTNLISGSQFFPAAAPAKSKLRSELNPFIQQHLKIHLVQAASSVLQRQTPAPPIHLCD